jgi:hypothetical protein
MNPLQTTGPGLQNMCGEITDAGGDCNVVLAVTGGNGDHTRERTSGYLGMTGVSSEIATTAPALGLSALAVLAMLVLAAITTTLRRRAR